MIDRRAFLSLATGILAAPAAARAQPAGKVWRVGYIALGTAELDRSWRAAFQEGLRGLGYVEGQNVVIEWRHAAGRRERFREFVAELIRLKVDVFVVYGGILDVMKATRTIPIVMAVSRDPVGEGIVARLARPGGNVTGLADTHADLTPKRLELLKEIAGPVSRVAVLWNPLNIGAGAQLKKVQTTAAGLGISTLSWEVRESGDIVRVFATAGRERPGALLIIPEPAVVSFGDRRIPELAIKHRLPAIGTVRQFAENGLLMSYGTDFAELWRRAATYVDKILKGAKPADLPIEQPTRFELAINLKTAKALGLTISPAMRLRADQVIE